MPTLSNHRLPPRGRPPIRRPRRAAWRLALGFGLGVLGGWLYGLLHAPTVTPADGETPAGPDPTVEAADPAAQGPVQVDVTGPLSAAGTTP